MHEAVYNKMQREKITIPKMIARWLCSISLPKPSRRIDFVPLFNLQYPDKLFRGFFPDRTPTRWQRWKWQKAEPVPATASPTPRSGAGEPVTCPRGTGTNITLLGALNSIPPSFAPLPVASKACVITSRGTSRLQKRFRITWDCTHEVCQKTKSNISKYTHLL